MRYIEAMKAKSSAHYQREYRRRLRDLGLVKKEVWILPENSKRLAVYEKLLRERVLSPDFERPGDGIAKQGFTLKDGEMDMAEVKRWTTVSLYEALTEEGLFKAGQASIELIDGVEPAAHIVMHEFGDLPLFLSVVGDQILVEALMWAVEDVADVAGFNDAILRTHKYFPLSTISLDSFGKGRDYYQMFGALSAGSIMPNVIFEIEVLASNVIQATEAYSNFLKTRVHADV